MSSKAAAAVIGVGPRQGLGAAMALAIAAAYWDTHRQHRSAWAHEIDLRPWKETF